MTCTCGYNVAQKWDSEVEGSLIKIKSDFTNVPKDCVVIKTAYFSINFADVCLRWGLYGYSNLDSVLYTFIILNNKRPKILLNFTDLLMNMLDFQFALDLILVEK